MTAAIRASALVAPRTLAYVTRNTVDPARTCVALTSREVLQLRAIARASGLYPNMK